MEDGFLIAFDLQNHVEELGHAVTSLSRDVESCKSAALDNRPDPALMDLRQASSGIDASRWLHEVLGVRCIFISGTLDDRTRELLSTVEPVAFIGKPILPHRLKREFERGLGRVAADA